MNFLNHVASHKVMPRPDEQQLFAIEIQFFNSSLLQTLLIYKQRYTKWHGQNLTNAQNVMKNFPTFAISIQKKKTK